MSRAAAVPGRLPLVLLALALLLSGLFALWLGLTGRFLPYDERFLGMTARQLCARHGCRIVHFMIHDRVAFGGALVAVAVLYLWLAESPLRQGQAWAWWAFLASGAVGFASFLAFLGFGYLDLWHMLATLGLVPMYALGLARSRRALVHPAPGPRPVGGAGLACLLAASLGLAAAGLTILVVGMTCVFVPQDLAFMGVSVEELHALNPRLVPLIAHDRAGFGGAVCCFGIALVCCVRWGQPSRGLWLALCLAGVAGFGTAIGIHPAVGYDDPEHLAPAVAGAALYLAGLVLTYREKWSEASSPLKDQTRQPVSR
jgi:hypothetical protein